MRANSETVQQVLQEALETMAFMPQMLDDNAESDASIRIAQAVVIFDGPENGRVELRAPVSILPELVQNMLGEWESTDYSTGQQLDALAELANVICGNFLSTAAGEDLVFNLHPPIVVADPPPQANAQPGADVPEATARIQLERGWIEASVLVDASQPTERADP